MSTSPSRSLSGRRIFVFMRLFDEVAPNFFSIDLMFIISKTNAGYKGA